MNTLKLAAVLVALTSAASAQVFTRSFPLVTTNGSPVGLECNSNGDLLFTDIGIADEIGLTTPDGNIILTRQVFADSPSPIGITQDGVMLYITDAGDTDVDLYTASGNYVSSFTLTGVTTFPEGITYSPVTGNLYIIDGTASQGFEFTTGGVLVNTFPLNGFSIDGIAHDASDNTFWIYDSGTDSIRHYDSNFVELSAVPGTVANGLAVGEGVAVIGTDIFVCAANSSTVAVFSTTAVFGDTVSYGMGCPEPGVFYEQFPVGGNDLSGASFTVVPAPNGFNVVSVGSFDPGFSNNLGANDDQVFFAQPLGFMATFPGLGTISAIDIDSNGRIGSGIPGSDFSESVSEFLSDAMVAVCWDDFDPSSGGGVYFDTTTTCALVTWDQVPQFGSTDSNTFQVKLHSDGRIECSYVTVSDDAIVGLSGGIGADPGSIDLSASLPFAITGVGLPLTLSASTRPVIGQNFDLQTSNIPPSGISGGTILGLLPLNLTLPLLPSGCTILSSGDLTTLPLNLGTGVGSLALPNNPGLTGITLFAQSIVLDLSQPSVVPAILSNGLQINIGDA